MRIYAVSDAGSIPVSASTAITESRRGVVDAMKPVRLRTLKTISLALLLPGLAGLIVSAMFSVHYLDTMPRWPSPEELRIVPRSIHGIVVYQTAEEDTRLSLIEYSSVGVFVIGLGLSIVYLEQWSSARAREAEEDELSEDSV